MNNEHGASMKTTTSLMSTAKINEIAMSRYGVTVSEMNPNVGDWLARHLHAEHGQPGFQIWKRIDNMMRKSGGSMLFPEWGSPLFPSRTK
jgi:hypothetical protein